MNNKDSYALLGFLLTDCKSMTFYEGNQIKTKSSVPFLSEAIQVEPYLIYAIIEYIRKLKISYAFAKDILNDDYRSVFYHKEWGKNSEPLPKKYDKKQLCTSEHDGQIWIIDEGRIGVWCEVDGFVAWLDEYKKVWIVDSPEEIKERIRKEQEWWNKNIKPTLEKIAGKIFSDLPDSNINDNIRTVKIAKFDCPTLPEYSRNDPLHWKTHTLKWKKGKK